MRLFDSLKIYSSYRNYYSIKEVIKDLLDFLFFILLRPFSRLHTLRWEQYQKKNTVKNVLIVFWGAAGDMITSSAAIKAVRDAYPGSCITFLGSSSVFQLFPGQKAVNRFIDYDKARRESIFRLIREIRKIKYDLAVNLKWSSDRAAFMVRASGARFTAGSGPRHWQLFYHLKARPAYTTSHQVERFIRIAEALGIERKGLRPVIELSRESRRMAGTFWKQKLLNGKKVIMVHPGAKEEYKRWPVRNFTELVRQLVRSYPYPVIVAWGPKEHELALSLQREIRSDRVIVCPETRNNNELAGFLKLCKLFTGNCSAPMNVAVAVDTASVVIMGPNNPVVWPPFGAKHRFVIPDVRCKKCTLPCQEKYICQTSIRVESVLDAVREELDQRV
ncbi:MAG: glycosyltransferase family 9 protein [bacterium]|nr:glycosyltransferase family 9 protein [bacterium]